MQLEVQEDKGQAKSGRETPFPPVMSLRYPLLTNLNIVLPEKCLKGPVHYYRAGIEEHVSQLSVAGTISFKSGKVYFSSHFQSSSPW